MAFKPLALPQHVQERLAAAREAEHHQRVVFANLTDADLAASARFWLSHCEAPRRHAPDQPVYDSTFWHVIVPEMLRRLSRSEQ